MNNDEAWEHVRTWGLERVLGVPSEVRNLQGGADPLHVEAVWLIGVTCSVHVSEVATTPGARFRTSILVRAPGARCSFSSRPEYSHVDALSSLDAALSSAAGAMTTLVALGALQRNPA